MKTSKIQRSTAGVIFLGTLLVASTEFAQNSASSSPAGALPGEHEARSTAPLEPTPLSVADKYITVIGGVVTGLGTVFGLPLVYQTFRKTRAEIDKINLEAAKIRKDLCDTVPESAHDDQGTYKVNVEGAGNSVNIITDPRWAASLLVLVYALIATIFYTIASYSIGALPLSRIITEPIRLAVYLSVFYPVFRAAREVKKNLGRDLCRSPGQHTTQTEE